MDINQVTKLLQRYQEGNVTPAEKELVDSWYRQLMATGEWEWGEGEKEQLQQSIESSLLEKIHSNPQVKYIDSGNRKKWWWAAAAVLILMGMATFFLINRKTVTKEVASDISHDVAAPQISNAVVTLANGERVFLDSISNGTVLLADHMKIVKLNSGEIVYQATGKSDGIMHYNTLENPRGSKVVNVVLSDGSKVWLNAGSSLKYPISFIENKRKVFVTGEAYFEVAHDDSKQFIVNKDAVDIIVMGTHFNVNAFEDDDKSVKVTLLQGSVKVEDGVGREILKPGQQAMVNDGVKIVNEVDLDMVMAWKNGYFQFDKASLKSVLKQIGRWYDVDVIYEGNNRPRAFMGEMERSLSLSEVLKILEVNNIHFSIEGKKLFIKPDKKS